MQHGDIYWCFLWFSMRKLISFQATVIKYYNLPVCGWHQFTTCSNLNKIFLIHVNTYSGCELKPSVKRGKCVLPRIWKHATTNTVSVHLIIVIFGSNGQTYWNFQLPYVLHCMCHYLKCLSINSFSIWRQDSTPTLTVRLNGRLDRLNAV